MLQVFNIFLQIQNGHECAIPVEWFYPLFKLNYSPFDFNNPGFEFLLPENFLIIFLEADNKSLFSEW